MFIRAIYESLLRPLLFSFEPEQTHHFFHNIARYGKPVWPLMKPIFQYQSPLLSCTLVSQMLENPVGLAAGFDKNGDLVEVLGNLGFGFAEIGSVTAQASSGNKKPRLFRLPRDRALINRLGLNGLGATAVSEHLQKQIFSLPIGLNIAKTNDAQITGDAAVSDMLFTFDSVKELPIFYITVNASCPNTEEGIMTEKHVLENVFSGIQTRNVRRLPVFVKLSPDSSNQLAQDIVELAIANDLAGFVCANTTTSRANLVTSTAELESIGPGGLSGPPEKQMALSLCRKIYQLKSANQIIIGCGGITSGQEAYEFIRSGCSAVQLYTGLVYHGPTLIGDINRELAALLHRDGIRLNEAVGLDSTKTSASALST